MSYNKKIIHALIVLAALMLSLVIYLTWFQVFKAPALAASGQNPRTVLAEENIKRGSIYSSDGERLAYSEFSGDEQIRRYPYENLYSHVIGYNNRTYGRSMLENSFNSYILGTGFSNKLYNLKQVMTKENKEGANLTLTIDHSLQKKAYELLGKRNGAIVAINPKTGATLALVSKPDYNPSGDSLKQNWANLSTGKESVFLSRATRGLYAPGSVFKTITAAAAVENGIADKAFSDTGSVIIDSHEFKNYGGKANGTIDIKKAFARSSNVVFVSLANELGYSKMKSAAEKFLIGKNIPYDIPLESSSCLKSNAKTNVAAVGMGQGDTLVTPLNMALVASAIANGGTIMQPYLVESADLSNGYNLYKHNPSAISTAVSKETAERVKEMMLSCVSSGTGTAAAVSGIKVAGKTGTAENTGEDHAWFIAFAPADDPEIAVCVMVENAASTGGAVCGPIVSRLISQWCQK